MRVGWINFNKEEEKIFTQSLFFGIFFGFTVGTIVFLFLILPTIQRHRPQSLLEWAYIIFIPFTILAVGGWFTSMVFACVKYKRKKESDPTRGFTKTVVALFISFPVLLLYAAAVGLFILIPLNDFLSQWLRLGILYPLGMLLVFPFVYLAVAIGLPDSKAGKSFRRFLRRLERQT